MRRSLTRGLGRFAPLATYVASRRALATHVHALTPARFLRRLDLLPSRGPELAPERSVVLPPSWTEPAEAAEMFDIDAAAQDAAAPPVLPEAAVLTAPRAPAALAATPAAVVAAPAPVVMPATVRAPRAAAPTRSDETPSTPAFRADRRVPVVPARVIAPTPATPRVPEQTAPVSVPPAAAVVAVAPLVPDVEPLVVPDAPAAAITLPAPSTLEMQLEAPPAATGLESAQATAVATRSAVVPPAPAPAPAIARREAAPDSHDAGQPEVVHVDPPTLLLPLAEVVSKPPARPPEAQPLTAIEVTEVVPRAAALVEPATSTDRDEARREAPVDDVKPTPPIARRRSRVQEMPPSTGRPQTAQPEPPAAPWPPVSGTRFAHPDTDRWADTNPNPDLSFDADDGSDRSPLAWAARLADSLRPASEPPAARPAPAERPAPPVVAAAAPVRLDASPAFSLPAPAASDPAPPEAFRKPRRFAPPRTRAVAPASRVGPSNPHVRGAQVAPASRAVPVSPEARRVLQPLVGIDPGDVTFVQGPAADAITAAHQADAVTAGTTVALGSAFDGDASPEGLGLIAHELTHVARHVSPRFVPPIARTPGESPLALDADEETVALRVEGRVRAEASRTAAPAAVPDADRGASVVDGVVARPSARHATTSPDVAPQRVSRDWGGLPAPWEPMPELEVPVVSPADQVEIRAGSAIAPAQMSAAPAAPMVEAAVPVAHAPVALHAASHDRAPAATSGVPAASEASAAKGPDLDQLARQVYAVLKRRLRADATRLNV